MSEIDETSIPDVGSLWLLKTSRGIRQVRVTRADLARIDYVFLDDQGIYHKNTKNFIRDALPAGSKPTNGARPVH